MKLNFEYCKICVDSKRWFVNSKRDNKSLMFFCSICGDFIFYKKSYKSEKYDKITNFESVTNEELKKIKSFKIKKFVDFGLYLNLCPYKLEHIVDQEDNACRS